MKGFVLFYFTAFLWLRCGADLVVCVEHVNTIPSLILAQPLGETEYLYQASLVGIIYKINKTDGTLAQPTPVLDISATGRNLTQSDFETGLFSITVHPNFTVPDAIGYEKMYIYYFRHRDWYTVLSEWIVPSNTSVVEASYQERIVKQFRKPYWNHNGGTLLWGPTDQYLYLTLGDGGRAYDLFENSQNMSRILGKILRLDVNRDDFPGDDENNYGIPPDNPFASGVNGTLPEIYASGMRNPWRCSFGIPSNPDALVCGDVGQNKFEEVTVISGPAQNHGWVMFEAMECTVPYVSEQDCLDLAPRATFPIFYYHGVGAIIGGYTYFGNNDPRLRNRYIFADYAFGINYSPATRRYQTDWTVNISENKLLSLIPNAYSAQALANNGSMDEWAQLTYDTLLTQPVDWVEPLILDPCPRDACPMTASEAQITGSFTIHSFGIDNENELYFLGPNGLHRIVSPDLCPTRAPTESPTVSPTAAPINEPTSAPTEEDRTSFRTPGEFRYSDATQRLSATLTVDVAQWRTTKFEFQSRAYNAEFPGPTLVVVPGVTLRLYLNNSLGAEPSEGEPDHNASKLIANNTNIHLHGMHVLETVVDDVIYPGAAAVFDFTVPIDHPAGTFWYHPHYHGSSGLQVEGGLAGALIVADPVEFGLSKLSDVPIVLQHVGLGSNVSRFSYLLLAARVGYNVPTNTQNYGGESDYVLVNGVHNPVLDILVGETKRVRFINAGGVYFVNPLLVDTSFCYMTIIALDGVYIAKPFNVSRVILPPGSRADVLVTCNATGMVDIVSDSNEGLLLGALDGYSGPLLSLNVIAATGDTTFLARDEIDALIARAAAATLALPLFQDIRNQTVNNTYRVDFYAQDDSDHVHVLNGKSYHEGDIMLTIPLDEVQEWTITALEKQHPYHQHVHSFLVQSYTLDAFPYELTGLLPGTWRDTIPVSDSNQVVVRFVPRNFSGKMVFHCHNIPHSDHGMMAVALIEAAPSPSQNNCNTYACYLALVLIPIAIFISFSFTIMIGISIWKETFTAGTHLPPVIPTINDASDNDAVEMNEGDSSSNTVELSKSDDSITLSQSSSDESI